MTDEAPEFLSVDMVRCAGHGICALAAPERIALDAWGFAHVDPAPVTDRRSRRHAVRAVRACPRKALRLNRMPDAAPRPTVGS
jgi:ferredoxin